jgi:hypothetical protein
MKEVDKETEEDEDEEEASWQEEGAKHEEEDEYMAGYLKSLEIYPGDLESARF